MAPVIWTLPPVFRIMNELHLSPAVVWLHFRFVFDVSRLNQRIIFLFSSKLAFRLICCKPKPRRLNKCIASAQAMLRSYRNHPSVYFLDSFRQGSGRLSWLVHVNVKRVPEPWFNIDAISLIEPATCTCTAAQHPESGIQQAEHRLLRSRAMASAPKCQKPN
jgi:hypothetical protein